MTPANWLPGHIPKNRDPNDRRLVQQPTSKRELVQNAGQVPLQEVIVRDPSETLSLKRASQKRMPLLKADHHDKAAETSRPGDRLPDQGSASRHCLI